MVKRKICVVTGTRAEYGLLRSLIQKINNDNELTLQLVVTGMHLSPEFGYTYKEIENDGFNIDKKVELDYYYLQNKSFLLDLKIIFLTFFKVFKKSNISH